jgi:tellurite resistance protein TehA-like permease
MYATAVQLLTHIPGLEFLAAIGPYCTWLAFAAWALVALGWLWSALMTIRAAPRVAPSLAASPGQPSGERSRGEPSHIP